MEEEDPKANAARHGMYGPLTHEVRPWYPHRLLCKRFAVRDPHPDGPPVAPSKTWEEEVGIAPKAPPQPESVDLANVEMKPLDSAEGGEANDTERDLGPRDLANIGLGEDPHQGVDTLTYVRPAMDVFKAIFASDEEDSDSDEGEDGISAVKNEAPISVLDAALASVRQPITPPGLTKTEEGPEAPVDLATFKPVFNIRTKIKDKDKDKPSKDKKKDKGKRVTLSFDVDEGADTEEVSNSKGKRRERDGGAERKPKKPKTKEDEGEWVEKPPPAVTSVDAGKTTKPDPHNVPLNVAEGGVLRARKRAIDFM